ncbi:hypothetical protein BDQ17DRAFT_1430584 [Cyathus striatus]|nr:hypothetical protein BDQ17DRAFT_1430584 [Cyathus striatus]
MSPVTRPVNIDEHLARIYRDLLQSGTYLGDELFNQIVSWEEFDADFKVVQTTDHSHTTNKQHSTNAVIASLSVILKIHDNDFFYTSEGVFAGFNRYIRNLSRMKLVFSGGCPSIDPFKSEYPTVIENLKWLVDQAPCTAGTEKRGLFTGPCFAPRIKVKHTLFTPQPEIIANHDPLDYALMRNWPLRTRSTRRAMPYLYDNFCINRPAVFGAHGNEIHSDNYESQLVHATVKVDFALSYWYIPRMLPDGIPCDLFSADLISIHTVLPPPSQI